MPLLVMMSPDLIIELLCRILSIGMSLLHWCLIFSAMLNRKLDLILQLPFRNSLQTSELSIHSYGR